jgi:autotransporter-associated beta strand protein
VNRLVYNTTVHGVAALLLVCAMTQSSRAQLIYSEDFESPVVTGYAQGTDPSGWTGATQGFGATRRGLDNKDGGDFTAPDGNDQVYAFRYTNSGMTTDQGTIGVLEANTTYVIQFDVVWDLSQDSPTYTSNTGLSYNVQFMSFSNSVARNDCRSTPSGAIVFASTTGNAPNDGSFETVSFSFRPTASEDGWLGEDLAIRLKGSTTSAGIDNIRVYKGALHWDINDSTSGAGGSMPGGNWDSTNTYWTTSGAGTAAAATWTAGLEAVFAAGTDGSGAYAITNYAAQDISGLIVQEGTLTIEAGTDAALRLVADADADIGAGLTTTINVPFTEDASSRKLTKWGDGTLALTADNSGATGGMDINQGVVEFNAVNSINGSARDITINKGGVMSFSPSFGAGNIPTALSGRVVASSDGAIAVDNYLSTSFDFNTPGLTATYLGSIANATYTGSLTPNGTTYRLGRAGGIFTVNTELSGSGYSALLDGDIVLASSNSLTGSITLEQGSLTLTHTNAASRTENITLNNNQTLTLRADSAETFQNNLLVIPDLNDTVKNTIHVENNGSGSGNTIFLNGRISITNQSAKTTTLTFTADDSYNLRVEALSFRATGNNANTAVELFPIGLNVTIDAVTNNLNSGDNILVLKGTTTGNSIGKITEYKPAGYRSNFRKEDSGAWTVGDVDWSNGGRIIGGTLVATGTLDCSSATYLRLESGSTLAWNNPGAVKSSAGGNFEILGGTLDNSSGSAITTSTYNPAMAWNGDFTFTGSSDLFLGKGAVSMDASRTLTISANTLSVGGNISGSGFSLTKAGAGTLELSGTNSYTGDTFINAGSLALSGSSTLSDSTTLWVTNAASMILNAGVNETIDQLYLNGMQAASGTWGSTASAADFKNDTFFSGSGVLTILSSPTVITNTAASAIDTTSATLNATLNTLAAGWNVDAFWGTSDGGTSPGSWDNTSAVGGWTNVGSTNISFDVTSLNPGTMYYYTFRATNSGVTAWAIPSHVLYTLYAPEVSSSTGATVLSSSSAELRGLLTAGGQASAWIYWGTSDGGTEFGSWDNSVSIGIVTQATEFTTTVTGLNTNETYYYRCYVTNSIDEAWSTPAELFNGEPSTPNSGQAYSLQITFTNFAGMGTLTNFPALIKLTQANSAGYVGFLDTTNGWDLRFWTNSALTGTELNYEIEVFNTNGTSYIWVQIPYLTNNLPIWASWGNPSDSNQKAYTTNGATWSEGYIGVWHLGANGGVEDLSDSSPNSYDGSDNNTVNATGMIGYGQDFDANSDYIDVGASSRYIASANVPISLSVWFKANTVTTSANNDRMFTVHDGGASSGYIIELRNNSGNKLEMYENALGNQYSDGTFTIGEWSLGALTFDGSTHRMFLDGTENASSYAGTLAAGSGNNAIIGNGNSLALALDGVLDEVRVSNVARSSNWIWASWMSQGTNHLSFTHYGTVSGNLSINTQTSGVSSVDYIVGEREASGAALGYYVDQNSNMVGTGGAAGAKDSRNVVLGFGLPTLPVGTVISSAELSFEITATRDTAATDPSIHAYLLNTSDPDSSDTNFFYHGPESSTTSATFVGEAYIYESVTTEVTYSDDQYDFTLTLSGDALALLTSFYGGDHIPEQSEAWFRFNLDPVPVLATDFNRYRIDLTTNEAFFGITGYTISDAVIANLAPTGVTHSTYTANASLAASGTNYTVYVHWGNNDGGTNAGMWDSTALVGSWTNVPSTNIGYTISGLTELSTNWYTFRATNAVTNVWATPSWLIITPQSGLKTGSLFEFK